MCSGFVSDLPNQIPFSHAVSPVCGVSLFRRQSTVLWCQDLEQENLCKWHNVLCVIAVTRCSERCDATCSTRVSRDTKSSATNQPCPDCRFRRDSYLVTILRVISESAQLFASCSNCSFCEAFCSLSCVVVYFSTTTLPGTFAFTFSATAMIEVSLSQTQSEPPNKQVFFHDICH